MSQSVSLQMVSPRALRSKNRGSSREVVQKRASSSQPFQDALTGEEQSSQDNDRESEHNALQIPQSNQNANKQALVFDQDNRLRRADPNQTPVRFPTKPVNRTQLDIEFDKNDSDTFLERLFSSRTKRASKQVQGSKYSAAVQTDNSGTSPKKRKSASNQTWRLFRGSDSSEEGEEDGDEEPGVDSRPTREAALATERRNDEEMDELEEEAEDEDMIAADLEVQHKEGGENDDHVRSSRNNDVDEDFEDRLDDDAIRVQKQETLQRRRERGEEREMRRRESQQQNRIEREASESEITGDDTVRRPENTQEKPRYRYTIGQNNVGRKKWTEEETVCLMSAIDGIMSRGDAKAKVRPYHAVLQLHGVGGRIDDLLASRNNMQLKDKVRNEILRMRRSGLHTPEWADQLFRTLP